MDIELAVVTATGHLEGKPGYSGDPDLRMYMAKNWQYMVGRIGSAEMLGRQTWTMAEFVAVHRFSRKTVSHSSSSQKVTGSIFKDNVTPAEVEAMVRGTFGGKFEYFRPPTDQNFGVYSYIAYTD